SDAQVLEVIQSVNQAAQVADPVAIAVAKGADVDLVNDCVLVPKRIVVQQWLLVFFSVSHSVVRSRCPWRVARRATDHGPRACFVQPSSLKSLYPPRLDDCTLLTWASCL